MTSVDVYCAHVSAPSSHDYSVTAVDVCILFMHVSVSFSHSTYLFFNILWYLYTLDACFYTFFFKIFVEASFLLLIMHIPGVFFIIKIYVVICYSFAFLCGWWEGF